MLCYRKCRHTWFHPLDHAPGCQFVNVALVMTGGKGPLVSWSPETAVLAGLLLSDSCYLVQLSAVFLAALNLGSCSFSSPALGDKHTPARGLLSSAHPLVGFLDILGFFLCLVLILSSLLC